MLRPGGKLLVVDIRHAKDYATYLREVGAGDVSVKGLGPRYWYGGL